MPQAFAPARLFNKSQDFCSFENSGTVQEHTALGGMEGPYVFLSEMGMQVLSCLLYLGGWGDLVS